MTTTVGSGSGQSQSQTTNYIPDYEPQLWFLREFGNNALGGEAAQYDWARRQWANNNALTSDVVNHGFEPMGSNELQQAQFERGMYDQSYNPTQAQQLQDANNYASPERVAQAQGGAEADVANQANQGMGQARQALTSAGITPGSGRGMAIAAQGAANRATQGASAANAARLNTQEQGRALQAQGRQNLERLPTQAAMEANQGYSGMSDAMNSAFGNTSLGAQMLGTPQQYLNIGINDVKFQPLGTTGSSSSSDSRSSMSFAGGGPTTGGPVPKGASPSHGMVTDDIDAKLNADEFIIPRDVAHYLGKKYLTQLIVKSRGAMGAPQKPIGPTMSGGKLVSQHAATGGGIASWTGGMGGATQGTAATGTPPAGPGPTGMWSPGGSATTTQGRTVGSQDDIGRQGEDQTRPGGPVMGGPAQGPGSQDNTSAQTGIPTDGQTTHTGVTFGQSGPITAGGTAGSGSPPPGWYGPGPVGTWSPTQVGPGSQDNVGTQGRTVGSQDDIGRQGEDQTRPGGPVMGGPAQGPGSQDTSTGSTTGVVTPPTLPDGTVAPPDNPTTTGSLDRRNIGQDQSKLTPGNIGTPQDTGPSTNPVSAPRQTKPIGNIGTPQDTGPSTNPVSAPPDQPQQRAQNWVPPQDAQTRGQGPGQGQGPGGIPDHHNFMQWLQRSLPAGIPPQIMQYLQSAFGQMPHQRQTRQTRQTRGRRVGSQDDIGRQGQDLTRPGGPVRGGPATTQGRAVGSQDDIGRQGQDQTRPGGPMRAAAGGNIFDTSSGGSGLPFGGGDSSSSDASSGSGSNTGSLSNIASSSAQGTATPAPPQGPGSQTNSTTQGQAAVQNWLPPQGPGSQDDIGTQGQDPTRPGGPAAQQPYQPYGNGVGIPQDPYPPDTTPLPGQDPVEIPRNPTPPPDDPGGTDTGGGRDGYLPGQRLAYAGISSKPHSVPANTGFVF